MKNYDKIKSGKMPITREQLIDMIIRNDDVARVDTSQITDMSYMFYKNSAFNQPIGDWDTSSVTDMRGMFYENRAFNQPIGEWDTSSVTDMSYMFCDNNSFNQPIGGWDTSSVTDMRVMFRNNSAFNQPICGWDTSNVINMLSMFDNNSAFNQPIGGWDTSSVTDMSYMFYENRAFNQPIGDWDTSSVTDMRGMFAYNRAFNQPIGDWDTSSVTDMNYMFDDSQLSSDGSYIWDNGVAVFNDIICRIKHMRGNVIRATTRNGDDCYIFTDGNGNYAHGETLRDAKESLIFKTSDRNKDDYKHMTTDTVLSLEDAMLCYHVVTGACLFGIRDFIKTKLNNEPADNCSIAEIIELTRDAYLGQQFADFFGGEK